MPERGSLQYAHDRFRRIAGYRHDEFCDTCKQRIFQDQGASVRQTKTLTVMTHKQCRPAKEESNA